MASVKVPEQKIILCGEYGVGKSSLFRRYATNTFVTATDRKSTLGLDHYEKVYRTGDKEVKVSVVESSHGEGPCTASHAVKCVRNLRVGIFEQ